ncbi:MAG: hypothetical protein ABF990_09745 [Acetobacter sp.]|uniref:hypothetical protein n=1 Tax=Acetobacter sp. TaxID=440 RepID=UPI0039E79DC4
MDDLKAATQEIVDLHVLLQAWFRGEGSENPQDIIDHFAPGYEMVGAAGRRIGLDGFAAALPKLRGSRPGLVMEIEDVAIHTRVGDALLATYREVQTQGESRTERWSSALFVPGSTATGLAWSFLHETFLP